MIGPDSHIGALFAKRRERLKLTQAELARRMGKTQTQFETVPLFKPSAPAAAIDASFSEPHEEIA